MKIETPKFDLPYPWQKDVYSGLKKYNVVVAPRQHGKTHLVRELIRTVLYAPNIYNPTVSISSTTLGQIYKIYRNELVNVFKYHPDFHWSSPDTNTVYFKRQQGDIATINLHGALKSPMSPKGDTVHLAIVDESGQLSKQHVLEAVSPTIDKTDGKLLVTGTVEANWYYDFFQRAMQNHQKGSKYWFAYYFKFKDKQSREIYTKDEIEAIDAKFDLSLPEDYMIYQKEYMCNWLAGIRGAPLISAYTQAEARGAIGTGQFHSYLSEHPVGTVWDNGSTSAIWFYQYINNTPRLVNYMEFTECSMHEICLRLKEWYHKNKAIQGLHIFPHTMHHKSQASKRYESLLTQVRRYMSEWGAFYYYPVPRVGNVNTKLDATRELLRVAFFDKDHCSAGLRAIQLYRRVLGRTGSPSESIVKDPYSHGPEALGELGMALRHGKLDMNAYIQRNNQSQLAGSGFSPISDADAFYDRNRTFPY